jgi:ceramide glucosyltransferase
MPMAVFYLIAYLILRVSLTWTTGKWGIGDRHLPKILWLIPVRDAISFIIWMTGFFSDKIIWRGLRYHIKSGQLIPIPSPSYAPAPRPESISSIAS